MSIIVYGGDRARVEQQLNCQHQWHGPCIDWVSRYYKCVQCYCMERDLNSIEEYWQVLRDQDQPDDSAEPGRGL